MRVGRTLVAAGAAVLTGLLLLSFGFVLPFAAAWALAVGAVALVAQLAEPDDPSTTAPRIDDTPDARSTEVAQMAWALNPHTGLAGERVTRRVRSILRHRLQRHRIDPDDPDDRIRGEALLPGALWGRLTGPSTRIADIEQALDVIDRLSTQEKP